MVLYELVETLLRPKALEIPHFASVCSLFVLFTIYPAQKVFAWKLNANKNEKLASASALITHV